MLPTDWLRHVCETRDEEILAAVASETCVGRTYIFKNKGTLPMKFVGEILCNIGGGEEVRKILFILT